MFAEWGFGTLLFLICFFWGFAVWNDTVFQLVILNQQDFKKNIHDYVTFYLQTHKIVEISKPKKEFKVPDSIEDFNILDFV